MLVLTASGCASSAGRHGVGSLCWTTVPAAHQASSGADTPGELGAGPLSRVPALPRGKKPSAFYGVSLPGVSLRLLCQTLPVNVRIHFVRGPLSMCTHPVTSPKPSLNPAALTVLSDI